MTNESTVSKDAIGEIMRAVVIENTAQEVLHKLAELESNRDHVLTRWIWELLQNARDTKVGHDTSLVVSIDQSQGEIVFRHNGAHFKVSEIGHLIYHGSTKIESTETIGQYGSGFLSTHLLSPEIEISGRLDDGHHFHFGLKREVASVDQLSASMAQAELDFTDSLSTDPAMDSITGLAKEDFTTQFRYRLRDDAIDAVDAGIKALKRCAPFVVAFNREFSSIEINSPTGTVRFQAIERTLLDRDGLQRVTVSQAEDGMLTERRIILAQSGKTSVAVPLATGDNDECEPLREIPRMFLGFPLIGTEDFSFPAVINSFGFTPTPNRDGVYIARNTNNNEVNAENQAAIEVACGLLITLLKLAARSGWRSAYALAGIPPIAEKYWLNHEWLRESIEDLLVEEFRQSPIILNEADEIVLQGELELPVAETDEGVKSLYDLLDGLKGRRERMPRRSEVAGWATAAKSWAAISKCGVSSLEEVTDGQKLATQVEGLSHDPRVATRTYRLSHLQKALKPAVSGVEWLDQFHAFLVKDGSGEVIRECRIVPSQLGFLRTLDNLQRDNSIDEELKDISQVMDVFQEWRIRGKLRDSRLTVVADDPGRGNWDSYYVVGVLIKNLREQAEKSPDENYAKASVRLFAWICGRENWDLLLDYPVFAEEVGPEGRKVVIKLESAPEGEVRTLAPVRDWTDDLQPFSDLFPRRHIIAKDFFEAAPSEEVWKNLRERGFCTRDLITSRLIYLDTFLPSEPLTDVNHETSDLVDVTNISFLTREDIGIMARVPGSQRLARLFWSFLTEYMVARDSAGLEASEALCKCGESHHYNPARWLGPLRDNKWIPLGADKRGLATAQSLADLLRGSGWEPGSLNGSPTAVKLLEAIGITHFDLLRSFGASNDEERKKQNSILTGILEAAAGDAGRLSRAHQYIEDEKNDPGLPEALQERREQRRRVHENQNLGKLVEDFVRATLKEEGFIVRRKPIGSDFEIEYDVLEDDQESGIEVTGKGQTWLVEVKATRDQRVRMTERQAKTAEKEGNSFLLCVVHLGAGNFDPTPEQVRGGMSFVRNIGPLVGPLCNNLDELKGHRDSITSGEVSGVQLEVEAGTARVRVAASLWEHEGFPIDDLVHKLLESQVD